MGKNVAQKLIESHLLSGKMTPGEEIAIRIDQTLTQDATGTMVMIELSAMGLDRVKTEVSVQYIDHNLLQTDNKNGDDHLFLESAARRFGIHISLPGEGISHCVHMQQFGKPGKTMVGSDSHTCAAGAIGMLAIGTGGIEVALAMAGEPFYLKMPKIVGVKLTGKLPEWVSAKDVILEMLRRYTVSGGVGKIFEYYGPGLKELSVWDYHVIANMGAELGATTSVFPSNEITRDYFRSVGREKDWVALESDHDATYDEMVEIDLSGLVPLIAEPSSPDKVVPVSEVEGLDIYQAYIGSSANPGPADFAISAAIVDGKIPRFGYVSLDVTPSSRAVLEWMIEKGVMTKLNKAGASFHESGCGGCIGMGQAPATSRRSLRTVPRNFKGRSGTKDDLVYLCSPETAAFSALFGVIRDPRRAAKEMGVAYPGRDKHPLLKMSQTIRAPQDLHQEVQLVMGPNIQPLPEFDKPKAHISAKVILKTGDNISTDDISPAGARSLPFRSNIRELSKFTFQPVDESFYERALAHTKEGFFVIGGKNYGQGSSREHAAIQMRYLGALAVITKSYARIHRQNLINFGIPPFLFENEEDYNRIESGDILSMDNFIQVLEKEEVGTIHNKSKGYSFKVKLPCTERERHILLMGGLIRQMQHKLAQQKGKASGQKG